MVPLISLKTATWMYYLHGSLFSLDAFLLVLLDPKPESRQERGVAWTYSCQMWILIWAGLWHWLAIPIFWRDITKGVVPSGNAKLFLLVPFLGLDVSDLSDVQKRGKYFREDFIQFCTVYQQKGGDVNKAQLHGCLSSKNYISSF